MTRLINNYSKARKEIHNWLDNEGVARNDNIVGRIGEYYAMEYLKKHYSPDEVHAAITANQKGYDFLVGKERFSVKTITRENQTGSTTPINLDLSWDYLVAVKLDDDFNLEAFSLINCSSLKEYLDNNSKRQRRLPSIKKTFRWWKILDQPLYKKM